MGTRQTGRAPYKGIGILSDRFTPDRLTAIGSGLTDSAYSQVGPRPGATVATSSRAKLDLEVSGAQQVALDARVAHAGNPGRQDVGVVWKLQSENDVFAYRDWATPNFANHWIAAEWTDSTTWDRFDLVALPQTGDLVLLLAQSAAASESVYCRRFEFPTVDEDANPQSAPTQTAQWSSAVRASRNPGASSAFGDLEQWQMICGIALPDGRVLAVASHTTQNVLQVYKSDDGGASWAPHSLQRVFSTIAGPTKRRLRGTYYRGEIVLFSADDSAALGIVQVASTSLGATWQPVDNAVGELEGKHSVAAIPGDGGIAMAYVRPSDSLPCVRVISSAFDPITEATEIEVDAAVTVDDVALVADDSGRLWVFGRRSGGNEVKVWGSLDNGATWQDCDATPNEASLFLSHDNGAKIGNFAAAMCRGWAVLAHNWTATVGNEDGSIGTLWSSGWGSVGHNPTTNTDILLARPSWCQTLTGVSASQSAIGIPIELPADVGPWTNGGAVAPTLVSPGEVDFSLAAQTGYVELDPAGTAGAEHAVLVEMRVASGSTGVASLQAGFDLRIADGAVSFRVEVRLGTTAGGFRVVDAAAGTTLADVVWDVTEHTQFICAVNPAGNLILAYRRPWHTRWIRAVSLEGPVQKLTDGGAGPTTNRIRIGAPSSVTASIRVRQWHHAELYFGPTGALSFGFRNTTDATVMYHRTGGQLNSLPHALPEVGEQGVQEAFIAATRGPGSLRDAYTITPVYDHGVDRLFPTVSPSPGETWRSTDLAEQRFTLDLGEDTRLGPIWHLLLGVLGANLKTVTLKAKTAAAGAFTTIGTYNGAQGFEGLAFTRNGDWIRPAAGSATAARWLERNELASGMAILDTGGSPVAFRIDANGPGRWTDPSASNTLFPEVRLAGLSGTPPTSGLCDLVFPSGVRPIRFTTSNPPTEYVRYLQIQIPVQTVPDAYYEIGNLFLGTTAVFGKRWSRGWTRTLVPNTSRRVSRYGVIRKRRDGPPAQRWSLAWPDGTLRRSLADTSPDYIGVGGSGHADVAVAAVNDVLGTLFAVLEESLGTETPVIALDSIQDGGANGLTVTNRLRFLYGTIDGNAQYNNISGRNEQIGDDLGRIDPISISELVR